MVPIGPTSKTKLVRTMQQLIQYLLTPIVLWSVMVKNVLLLSIFELSTLIKCLKPINCSML